MTLHMSYCEMSLATNLDGTGGNVVLGNMYLSAKGSSRKYRCVFFRPRTPPAHTHTHTHTHARTRAHAHT